MLTYNNPILEKLPKHLQRYVVNQQYAHYTSIDQAVWRYVMRQNYAYLKDLAYYPYIPGLSKAGLTIEYIPDLQEMNDQLKKIGWGAVTVDGFIPPSVFMEFQANRVLVIAADIRQLEHIGYTPAPDIIHESSGHAPIIGEPEYAAYLQYFGEIGVKAMASVQDMDLYNAIRELSILKEEKNLDPKQIEAAEKRFEQIKDNMGEPSEMALLSRLHWWTVEYGLIGSLDNPKIYGAGLLSSISESAECMRPEVKKLPYTIDAVNYTYDITKPQPQLFVCSDFQQVYDVLEEFANTMSFRIGGKEAINKAINGQQVCTAVYSSGLQVTGKFVHSTASEELIYIQTKGATKLSFENEELEGHGTQYHREGFGSPVGKLKGVEKDLEDLSIEDLSHYGLLKNNQVRLLFESGIEVAGSLSSVFYKLNKLILISLERCTVRNILTHDVLFKPEWGMYDMAVGAKIISVYPAPIIEFQEQGLLPENQRKGIEIKEEALRLLYLFSGIRSIRENQPTELSLFFIYDELNHNYPNEWLAYLELLEIAIQKKLVELSSLLEESLMRISQRQHSLQQLIANGIKLAKEKDIHLKIR